MAAKDNDDRKSDNSDGDISLDMSQAAVKKMIGEARERATSPMTSSIRFCRLSRFVRTDRRRDVDAVRNGHQYHRRREREDEEQKGHRRRPRERQPRSCRLSGEDRKAGPHR